ncbi:PepSY domain-containing protein [Actinoplanes sp. TRM 88003]|uniref:PepSY domain-containing protein n=1 Tax=Paractinoplanes aksuensis TaxID=2939490 RepID=A0ABT1DEV4_9ACTN|nr:PepSY domain-containing protein [Actinoplanes aksuensis]MCO8269356.1 PepSY domain-containing protein [Actinoplanes aksuensis]
MKRSYAIAAAVGAAAVLGITGTALAAGGDDSSTPSPLAATPSPTFSDDPTPAPFETSEPGSVTPSPRTSSSSASSGLGSAAGGAVTSFSAEQARAKALATVGGGRVTKVERDTEHGRAVWEVEVHYKGVEHDLDIDRKTGAVTDHDRDRDDDRGRDDDDRDDDNSGRHGGDDRHDDDRHGDDD